jgi:endonuclease/exonuclease/phosphatase family metal-dependent hydrolase
MPTPFTVMSWNLENLFLVGAASGPKTAKTYKDKIANLARIILSIGPDVLGLQEIGDERAFADLQNRLHGKYPHAAVSAHPDARGIRVGYLAREEYPFALVEDISALPAGSLHNIPDGEKKPAESSSDDWVEKMGRGALKVTVMLNGQPVHIINAHLKSKLITYPGGRRSPKDENERARHAGLALLKRTAESIALRVYINKLIVKTNDAVILLGDMNDDPAAATSQILAGPEDGDLKRPDKADDVRLYNLESYITPERRYSRVYRNRKEMIDHIYVSYELIFSQRQVDSFVEPIRSIDEDLAARRSDVFPDHAPVYARFEV